MYTDVSMRSPSASVAVMTWSIGPYAPDGVPETTPVDVSNESPAPSAGSMLNKTGAVPPVVVSAGVGSPVGDE